MKVTAAILAAGSSSRLGSDKTLELLGGKPVWRWSYDTFSAHNRVFEVLVVTSEANYDQISSHGVRAVRGGATRQESARCALQNSLGSDVILFHDAGRPFVTEAIITNVIDAVGEAGAAGAAITVKDTIRDLSLTSRYLHRASLRAMQTPQGGLVSLFEQAYSVPLPDVTDDLAMLENIGVTPTLVEGSETNFKITTPEDLKNAQHLVGNKFPRIGSGYDVHCFSDDPDRPLMLGGVRFEGARALEGHSDADALLHAIVDALLGAAALGDIGQLFPNNDPQWKNAPSLIFLKAAGEALRSQRWQIVNIDATVIAEEPKVMKKATQIRSTVAETLGIQDGQVSVKATTNEKLGFIGRSEGIAAFATAMIAPF